ncbi:hypothetical protein [Streptomyces sp. P17]|uniref:hypothetical protein n=1 Tax=Streptomyces sp. P17 TaxID=3074716 RepID=UPI0028F438A9|nr:hypothetical protein [Streptomyces sp. P17]MDT9697796.1 hypothetical protein [Streptomyces sp. P17]
MPRKVRAVPGGGPVPRATADLGSSRGPGARTGPVPAFAVREDMVRDALDPKLR